MSESEEIKNEVCRVSIPFPERLSLAADRFQENCRSAIIKLPQLLGYWRYLQKSFPAKLLLVTAFIESATCIGRFGFGFSILENIAVVKTFTFGVRVHHAYLGFGALLLAVPAYRIRQVPKVVASWILAIGGGLLLSDAFHHFIVLKLITGRTDFP